MKLRTVLGELSCTDASLGSALSLDMDVLVSLSPTHLLSFENLLRLAPPEGARDDGFMGITMVYRGHELKGDERPAERSVLVASALDAEDFALAFEGVPELHFYLEHKSRQLFEAFQSTYDIQRFATKAHEVLGNPLFIVNSDLRLLASAGEFPEDRADVQEEIHRGYVSEEVNAELESNGILETVRHAGHSIISENPRFGQRWVTSIINYHHLELGRFDMLEQDRTITDADLELVDYAGSLAAIMIDKMGAAGARAGTGSSVLADLIEDSFANEKTMRAQLALTSMPLDETYVLVTLVGELDVPRSHLHRVAARVSHAFRHCLWVIRENRLVTLISLGARLSTGYDGYERAERLLSQRKAFVATLERNGYTAYVCEPFEQLALASCRYWQCQELIDATLPECGPIVYFWKHRFAVLANQAHTFAHLDMMLDKRVIAMGMYDRDHGTFYLDTAIKTVEHPGSPADAAKALNVHRNTYFYRVNKISELFYLDLRKGSDRLAVAFSHRFLAGVGDRMDLASSDLPDIWGLAAERMR